MKSIHGKLCAVALLAHALGIAQEMTLELATTDGDRLEQALVGQPFLARVTIAPATSSYSQPELSHSDHLQVRPAGFHMQTINGASEITYNYRVYADIEGTFTIGPARLTTQQQSHLSNQLSVTVVTCAQNQPHKNKDSKAFMRLFCDKKEVVVTEKVRCALRFYSSNKRIQLRHVGEPEENQCPYTITKKEGPFTGREMIDGVEYDYHEWTWELYPQQEGTCLIPAYSADYIMPNKKNDLFSMFTAVFPTVNEQKRVYSNGLSLSVKKLPPSKIPAQAVGTFQSFKARLESHAIKQGEGTVLVLELEGDADLEHIKSIQLQGVPQGLRWYESKQHIVPSQSSNQKKLFEYIIQATQAGDWEIPSQSFVYFDTNKRAYRTLKTSPVALHVVALAPAKENQTHKEPAQPVQHITDDSESQECSAFEIAQGPWAYSRRAMIPWAYLFLVCVSSAAVVFWHALTRNGKNGRKKKYTDAKINTLIALAKKNNDHAALYHVMRIWLIQHAGTTEHDSIEHAVELLGKRYAISVEKQHQWYSFWTRLSETRFGAPQVAYQSDTLFEQAKQWIDFWKELT